jgi:hypothetical protein
VLAYRRTGPDRSILCMFNLADTASTAPLGASEPIELPPYGWQWIVEAAG